MMSLITRIGLFSVAKPHVLSCFNGCMYRFRYCSIASKFMNFNEEKKTEKWVPFSNTINIGKYHEKSQFDSSDIMVVDSDTWRVSCGLASVCKGMNNELEQKGFNVEGDSDRVVVNDNRGIVEGCPNFDEIEDMRVYGNLFYKVDRNSMEFEECRIDFRRKRNSSNDSGNHNKDVKSKENPTSESSKKKRGVNDEVLVNERRLETTIKENYTISLNNNNNNNNNSPLEKKKRGVNDEVLVNERRLKKTIKENYTSSLNNNNNSPLEKKKRGVNDEVLVNEKRLKTTIKENYTISLNNNNNNNNNNSPLEKKKRALTFNQLTGPYHEPFCLDIYVSKGSVRACVIHRATSKVVVVAHSISKDIKYELGSAKSRTAAATVGRILAQRALEDDIHNVMFMPRKGDKLEGKVQIVLQSILDNGVDVKVKLKQRNYGRPFAKVNRFKH